MTNLAVQVKVGQQKRHLENAPITSILNSQIIDSIQHFQTFNLCWSRNLRIYNENKETFVHCNDAQKGIRKNYNYSIGFLRKMEQHSMKEQSGRILTFDNCKDTMQASDNYDRELRDRGWCFKRGGRGVCGDDGEHHNFLMKCILQNTSIAYHAINKIDHADTTFQVMNSWMISLHLV